MNKFLKRTNLETATLVNTPHTEITLREFMEDPQYFHEQYAYIIHRTEINDSHSPAEIAEIQHEHELFPNSIVTYFDKATIKISDYSNFIYDCAGMQVHDQTKIRVPMKSHKCTLLWLEYKEWFEANITGKGEQIAFKEGEILEAIRITTSFDEPYVSVRQAWEQIPYRASIPERFVKYFNKLNISVDWENYKRLYLIEHPLSAFYLDENKALVVEWRDDDVTHVLQDGYEASIPNEFVKVW